jgi:hypothetical protein
MFEDNHMPIHLIPIYLPISVLLWYSVYILIVYVLNSVLVFRVYTHCVCIITFVITCLVFYFLFIFFLSAL